MEAGSERHKVQKTQSDDVAQIHLGANGPNGIFCHGGLSITNLITKLKKNLLLERNASIDSVDNCNRVNASIA